MAIQRYHGSEIPNARKNVDIGLLGQGHNPSESHLLYLPSTDTLSINEFESFDCKNGLCFPWKWCHWVVVVNTCGKVEALLFSGFVSIAPHYHGTLGVVKKRRLMRERERKRDRSQQAARLTRNDWSTAWHEVGEPSVHEQWLHHRVLCFNICCSWFVKGSKPREAKSARSTTNRKQGCGAYAWWVGSALDISIVMFICRSNWKWYNGRVYWAKREDTRRSRS